MNYSPILLGLMTGLVGCSTHVVLHEPASVVTSPQAPENVLNNAKPFPTKDEMLAASQVVEKYLKSAPDRDRIHIVAGLRKLGMEITPDYKKGQCTAGLGLYVVPEQTSVSVMADLHFDDSDQLIDYEVNIVTLSYCGTRSKRDESYTAVPLKSQITGPNKALVPTVTSVTPAADAPVAPAAPAAHL